MPNVLNHLDLIGVILTRMKRVSFCRCFFRPTNGKGKHVLLYCRGLAASTKNNHAPVEHSFCSAFVEDKDPRCHTLQPRDLVYWKSTSKRTLSPVLLKGSHEVLRTNPCAPKLQGVDPWIQVSHLKKTLNPVKPTHHPVTWRGSLLGSEADDIWGWWLSQDVWTFVSILSLILLSPSFPWEIPSSTFSNPLQKR